MKKRSKTQILYSFSGVVCMLAFWLLMYLVVKNDYVIPSPFEVLKSAIVLLFDGELYSSLLSTFLRVIIAVALSLTVSTVLAFLSAFVKGFCDFLTPIIAVLRSLPILAVLLIILVWVDGVLKDRAVAPIIVCLLTLIPLSYSQIYDDLSGLTSGLGDVLKVYNVAKKKQIPLFLKGIIPTLIKVCFETLSFGLKLVVSGEILASVYQSIGGDIYQASIYSNVVLLTALTLLICVLGIAFEILGKIISQKIKGKYL